MSLKRLLYGGLPQIGGGSYQSVVLGLAPASLLAYWPLTETSGTQATDVSGNARHGTYSGVTLAQIAGPGASMGMAGLWDGLNDTCNIFSASLQSAFDKNVHSVSLWALVSAGSVWSDGINRIIIEVSTAGITDGAFDIFKSSVANRISYQSFGTTGGGTNQTTSSTAWVHYGLVVNGASAIPYFNATPLAAITRGSWVNAMTVAHIGSRAGTSLFWSGYLSHCALWNAALTPAQMQVLATAR